MKDRIRPILLFLEIHDALPAFVPGRDTMILRELRKEQYLSHRDASRRGDGSIPGAGNLRRKRTSAAALFHF